MVNITKLKYFLLLPLIFFSINLQSQAEASNWHFGYGAGLTFNTSNGQIHIYEGDSIQGKDAQKQMDNGEESKRKYLQNKFKELSEGSR